MQEKRGNSFHLSLWTLKIQIAWPLAYNTQCVCYVYVMMSKKKVKTALDAGTDDSWIRKPVFVRGFCVKTLSRHSILSDVYLVSWSSFLFTQNVCDLWCNLIFFFMLYHLFPFLFVFCRILFAWPFSTAVNFFVFLVCVNKFGHHCTCDMCDGKKL